MPFGGAMYSNPALAHEDFRAGVVTVPIPLGLPGIISSFSGEEFDVLYLLDAVFHFESYLFNPASGELGGAFGADVDEDGEPDLEFDFDTDLGDIGGFVQSLSRGITQSVDLPVVLVIGGQTFALHPFAKTYAQFRPSGSLGETLSVGLDRVRFKVEAGVSADWLYATELAPVWEQPGAKRYVGFRLAPFVGLAKINADIRESDLSFDTNGGVASFRLDAASYLSLIGSGGGGGVKTDWGVMDVVPLSEEEDADQLVFGFSVQNLSLSYWQGERNDLVGEGSSEAPDEATLEFVGENASRFFLAPDLKLLFHTAYVTQVDDNFELTVAGDSSYDIFSETFSAALGAQGLLNTAFSDELALRAGLGWERGLKWGLGAGVTWGWFGLDTALHSYRSPASSRNTYGLALSSRFNF